MKFKFNYVKHSHGSLRWRAYCVVTELIEGKEVRVKLESMPSMFKFGATWSLKRLIRQHYASGCRKECFSQIVKV